MALVFGASGALRCRSCSGQWRVVVRWIWRRVPVQLVGLVGHPHLCLTHIPNLHSDARFRRELPGDSETGPRRREVLGVAWSQVDPTPVVAPRLLAHSHEVASLLGIGEALVRSREFADVFAGNALYAGMQPWAANYGGHQ